MGRLQDSELLQAVKQRADDLATEIEDSCGVLNMAAARARSGADVESFSVDGATGENVQRKPATIEEIGQAAALQSSILFGLAQELRAVCADKKDPVPART